MAATNHAYYTTAPSFGVERASLLPGELARPPTGVWRILLMKRFFVGYLLVSSVVLHVAAVAGAVVAIYWFRSVAEIGKEWAHGATEPAVVRDVSDLRDGDYSYHGYSSSTTVCLSMSEGRGQRTCDQETKFAS